MLFALLPLVFSLVVLETAFLLGLDSVFSAIKTSDFTNYEFLQSILSMAVLKWLVMGLVVFFAQGLIVYLSVFLAFIMLGFLTPSIVKTLHKNYYENLPKSQMGVFFVLGKIVFYLFVFFLLFVLVLPFLLLPFINFMLLNLLFFWLFYKFLVLDVASNLMTNEQFRSRRLDAAFLGVCFVFFLLSLVPFVGLFAQVFFVIFISHYFFMATEQS